MHLGTGDPKHECPKPGDTVCYWRSHGIKRLRMAAAQTHGVRFECRRTLACRAGHRNALDPLANYSPIKIGKDGRAGVRSKPGSDPAILQQCHNPTAERLT